MKLNIQDIRNITENVVRRLIEDYQKPRKRVYESPEMMEDLDMNSFEEYEQNYPNSEFNPSQVTTSMLSQWCRNCGDFLFIYKGIRGWNTVSANTEELQLEVASDIAKSTITPTHEMDTWIRGKVDFDNDYIAVYKVETTEEAYYVIYEQPK